MQSFILIILLCLANSLNADILNISDLKSKIDLLPHSSILIDKTNKLTLNHIKKKDKLFIANDEVSLGYGYSPDITVWVKFTLKNDTDKRIEKIIEYDNTLTTNIIFFDGEYSYQDGLLHINKKRKSITPFFNIDLEPQEAKTYYIKASSYIATLIVKLNLWDRDDFYGKEISHQFILALFFGAMAILSISNLFIYFFTKDISYLYYVFYIIGVSFHHSLYTGIVTNYFLDKDTILFLLIIAPAIISFPIFFLALFTKTFLGIEKQVIHNRILSIFLIVLPLSVVAIFFNNELIKYRNLIPLLLTIYLIYLTIFNVIIQNRQAYFILFGWVIIFIAILAMNLSSSGLFSLFKYFNYITELAFVLEGIVFSIALSDKINNLQSERNIAHDRLIEQKNNEKKRLKIQVDEKTIDLKLALDEKGLLLKEINHRVKNNMQTIVSLIRLQNDKIDDDKYKDILHTIQNRINAMSHLHEILYQSDNIKNVNVNEYFVILVDELQYSFEHNIDVSLDITVNLDIKQAIYCGLIFNELITNAFKYAFPDTNGKVDVKLFKIDNQIKLIVSDNGIGYDQSSKSDTLGLLLIESLVKIHFKGTIDIQSDDGVTVEITWNDTEV